MCAVLEAPSSGKSSCLLTQSSVTVILLVPGPKLGSGSMEMTLNWRTIGEEDSPNQKVLTDCSEPDSSCVCCLSFPSPLPPLPLPPTQYKLHDSTNLIWLVFSCLHNVQNNVWNTESAKETFVERLCIWALIIEAVEVAVRASKKSLLTLS